MMQCGAARNSLHRYIDGELCAADQLAYEAHLLECATCLTEYEDVRKIVDAVRGSKPLYPVPAALSAKVGRMVDSARSAGRSGRRLRVAALIGSLAATLLLCTLLPNLRGHGFTSFAADTHLQYAKGMLPLAVSSDDVGLVSSWLGSHLQFSLKLPNYPSLTGEQKSYSLVGARLIHFEGRDVAYLAYTMHNRLISLLVAPDISVVPAKYESYRSGRLVFQFSSENGLKLITWKDHGLSYALVSDLEIGGAQSCIICHGSQAERRKFENLLRLDDSKEKK